VSRRHIGHDPAHFQKALPPRRPGPLQIPIISINVGLIDRNILADQIPHALHHFPHEAQITGNVVPLSESAPLLQPQGVVEVVEGQQHGDPRLFQRLDLLPIVGNSLLIKDPISRLHPAPFHSHAVALDAHILHQLQILPPPLIVVHGAGGIAVILDIPPAVPVVPVAVIVSALDLRSRGSCSQKHTVLQLKLHRISSPRRQPAGPYNPSC
jgi:hypothetical protein